MYAMPGWSPPGAPTTTQVLSDTCSSTDVINEALNATYVTVPVLVFPRHSGGRFVMRLKRSDEKTGRERPRVHIVCISGGRRDNNVNIIVHACGPTD
jgi:hypothetical protein